MTCHSGGTLEIYVEPHLPAPALWVTGTTPIAAALVTLGSDLGFAVTLLDPIAEHDAFPGAGRVVASDDLVGLDPDASPYVVVASQGQWDEAALEAALGRNVAYVGLVASPKRAEAVRDYLREQGIPDDRLAALRAPAGLDMGAETPEEIALSILAEIVTVRRGRADFVASPGPATLAGPPREEAGRLGEASGRLGGASGRAGGAAGLEAIAEARPVPTASDEIVLLDPVCGMTVDRGHARHLAEHAGTVYAFCSVGCRARFIRDPAAYVRSAV